MKYPNAKDLFTRSEAARQLGMSLPTFDKKRREYNLSTFRVFGKKKVYFDISPLVGVAFGRWIK